MPGDNPRLLEALSCEKDQIEYLTVLFNLQEALCTDSSKLCTQKAVFISAIIRVVFAAFNGIVKFVVWTL